MTDDQLPAVIPLAALTTPADTYIVPALIADLGEQASWRYVEFFTANIANDHTRRAYARACTGFFAWCDDRGLTLTTIRPHDVATYIEELQFEVSAPSVKQQLATGWSPARSCRQIPPRRSAVRSMSSRPARRRCLKAASGESCSPRSRT